MQKSYEGCTVLEDEKDFEHSADESYGDSLRHEQEVEEEDVDEDRSENREAEWNEAADEDEQTSDDLQNGDEGHVLVRHEDGGEGSRIAGWHRRLGYEVQYAVETEDEKCKAKQDTSDEDGDFHGCASPDLSANECQLLA